MISSTKGATGHLLGASGSIEAIFAILSIADNVVPGTLNFERVDAGLEHEFGILDHVRNEARSVRVDSAMSNSFGFGYASGCG
jgi:3-oxoacyl-[acyl-carrier-protein] synthase II